MSVGQLFYDVKNSEMDYDVTSHVARSIHA